MEIIKRGKRKWFRSVDNETIYTSLTIDKEGSLIGKGTGGTIIIKKNDIKWAEYGN